MFGLRLGFHLYGAAENVSIALQGKDISMQDVLCVVDSVKAYYKCVHSEEEFDCFYDKTVATSKELNIGEPDLPRQRRRPARYYSESFLHVHCSVKAHYHAIYYEACDLLSGELERRFENQHVPAVLSIES